MRYELRQLDAHFLGHYTPGLYQRVKTLEEAQGIMFQCPKCAEGKERCEDGFIGAHSIICWFANRGIPDNATPGPGRWNPSGTGIDDLTFVGPTATSILLKSGCGWHGFITNGVAE